MIAAAERHGDEVAAAPSSTAAAPVPPGLPDHRRGRLFVLSGPSGVGKSTVLTRLCAVLPELWMSVSATTRAPRPGDVDGTTYYFVSREQFGRWIDEGRMLEWAEFAGNLYGTPREPVEQRLAAGRDVILEIELQGARQVRAATRGDVDGGASLIFLAPPSFEELTARLTRRGTESDEIREQRLDAARRELAAEPEFDHTVVNHDVETAVAGLVDWVAAGRPGANPPSGVDPA